MRFTTRSVAAMVAAAAVLSPLTRAPTNDTYPLSTYPMFAADRGALHRVATAVELTTDGTARRLSPELIAGTDEVILAAVTVERSVRSGRADELCGEILVRVGAGRTVEIRTETVDAVALIADGAAPAAIDSHARCES